MVQKIVQKNGPKNGPKSGPKSGPKNSPVHILPYATGKVVPTSATIRKHA